MEEPRFIWYWSDDGFGEKCLDLTTCTRFVLASFDPETEPECELIYYKTCDGRWFEWRVDVGALVIDGEFEVTKEHTFRQVDPRVVTYAILLRRTYGLRLPTDLERYREYGNYDCFFQWYEEQRKTNKLVGAPPPSRPRWDDSTRVLYLGTQVCHKFKRKAPNQIKIIEAFDKRSWENLSIIPCATKICSRRLFAISTKG
jgi:hypothetical protein